MVSSFFTPAYSSLKAKVIKTEFENTANALTQITKQLAVLLGPAFNSFIATIFTYSTELIINSITFITSFSCLFFVRKNIVEDKVIYYKKSILEKKL